jgi:hypothetical protein
MSATWELAVRAIVIGVGATVISDVYALLLKRILHVPSLPWPLVGRWIGHWLRGRFAHAAIGQAEPVRGEAALGWAAHYAIGIAFAALLLAVTGIDWALAPTLLPALAVGVGTVVAPFFLLQPAFGLGIAASKTPKPNLARLRSLATHTMFGFGLYLAALAAAPLWRA